MAEGLGRRDLCLFRFSEPEGKAGQGVEHPHCVSGLGEALRHTFLLENKAN